MTWIFRLRVSETSQFQFVVCISMVFSDDISILKCFRLRDVEIISESCAGGEVENRSESLQFSGPSLSSGVPKVLDW